MNKMSFGLVCAGILATACSPAKPPVPIAESAPAPRAPFTDYRFEAPGNAHKITVNDLPAPYATSSEDNGPILVPRPTGTLPKAPDGFKVNLYAEGLGKPRAIRLSPSADIFVAESGAGRIRVFRGMTAEGKPERSEIFAGG